MRFRAILLSLSLVLAIAGFAGSEAAAVPLKVTVDFTGSGLSAADQTAVLTKIKAKYVGIDVDISTTAGGAITLSYKNINGDGSWGDSDKRGKTCKMHAKRVSLGGRAAVFNTAEKKRNLWAETGAHELGHLLCAVHNKDEPNSLMTLGSMVTWAERAADARSFTATDKTNIAKGIQMLKNGESWDLDAVYDNDDFTVIPGTVQIGPDEPDDFGVSFQVDINDPSNSFSFGYVNDLNEFVEWMQPGVPQSNMHFDPYVFANFAIAQGLSVFPFDLTQPGANVIVDLPRSPSEAWRSNPTMPYFGRIELIFPASYTGSAFDVNATLDADVFGPANGFALEEVTQTAALTVPMMTASEQLLLILLIAASVVGVTLIRRRRATS